MRSPLPAVLILFSLAACSDGTADPEQGPRLDILSGHNVTDTISSSPTQGLVLRVLDDNGRPESGVEVRFEAPAQGLMAVSGVGSAQFTSVAGAMTDAAGRATVRVRFGTRAGAGWIAILVPLYNMADTARYTVLPGAPTRVTLAPRDTVISVGGSFTYRGGIVDRADNPRPERATFEVVGQSVQVNATSGAVVTNGYGTSRVRARASIANTPVVDSATITVIPVARVAANSSGLIVNDLTGANRQTLGPPAQAPMWEPNGNRIVFGGSGLSLADLNGTVVPLATPGISNAAWPEWSSDRQWIYFEGNARIWRIHPDGSGLVSVSPTVPAAGTPTPSPDGRSVAYVHSGSGLVIQDLSTGVVRAIAGAAGADSPRWSPDGQWIAYTKSAQGELMLVQPDGTDLHRIGVHGLFRGISWSPDSQWILGNESSVTLVEVSTGAMTYLPWRASEPSWRR